MNRSDDISAAVSLLKQTLPEMNKRKIPTTPENYAVWYEYVSGRNTELVNEINLLDQNKTAFTTAVHKDLYQKHIASERESLANQLSDNVKDIINRFLLESKHEEEGLGQYSKALSDISSEAEATQSIGELKLMVSQLIEHTRQREAATCAMQESLSAMTQEMQKLRSEVARLSGESTLDPLTRIPGRHVFDDDVESHIAMSSSEGESLSLVILDVDNFGAFNEKFGTAIGDKVLKFIATMFKKNLKGSDCLARYGDDAFAILLPDTDQESAIKVADNLRSKLARQTLSDSAEKIQLGTITVSSGVTELHPDGDTARSLIARAEKALNLARAEGGNIVCTS